MYAYIYISIMIDFIRIILKPDYGIKIYVNDILLLYICQYLIQRLYMYIYI